MDTSTHIVVDGHNKHIEIVKELVSDYINTWYSPGEPWSAADVNLIKNLPDLCVPPMGACLVIFVNNVPAGCILLKPSDESTVEMVKLFVKPEFRRTGAATVLIQEVITRADRMNKMLELEVYDQKVPAIKLYQKLGFIVKPSRTNNFILMQYSPKILN